MDFSCIEVLSPFISTPLPFFFFSHNARSFISTWLGVEDAGTFTEGHLSDLGIEQLCSESQGSWISSFLG